uniref:Uncharacterized protein n=1 Tax=Rhizobium phage IG49 TaxID=3129228 RepID=A0AAU8HZN3_9CAUD
MIERINNLIDDIFDETAGVTDPEVLEDMRSEFKKRFALLTKVDDIHDLFLFLMKERKIEPGWKIELKKNGVDVYFKPTPSIGHIRFDKKYQGELFV